MAFDTWSPPVKPRVSGTSLKLEQAMEVAQFGDGYEQTAARGINSVRETWTLAWPGIFNDDADAIESFVLAKGYVTAFWYTVPGRLTAKRFKFVSFERFNISGHMDGITISIREVFDIET